MKKTFAMFVVLLFAVGCQDGRIGRTGSGGFRQGGFGWPASGGWNGSLGRHRPSIIPMRKRVAVWLLFLFYCRVQRISTTRNA